VSNGLTKNVGLALVDTVLPKGFPLPVLTVSKKVQSYDAGPE